MSFGEHWNMWKLCKTNLYIVFELGEVEQTTTSWGL